MQFSGSCWGKSHRTTMIAALVALAAFLGSQLLVPNGAEAQASAGEITGCYKAKGKKKKRGTLRIVPAAKKCKKKEKRISWNAAGQTGPAGPRGAEGSDSADVSIRLDALESALADALEQIELLTEQVATLEGLLAGVTNQELLDAIGAAATVGELCTAVPELADVINQVVALPILGGLVDPVGDVSCT